MSNIQLIIGSVTGTAEYAGEMLEKALHSHGHQVSVLIDPYPYHLQQVDADLTLIVTSTDDDGQLPSELRPVWHHLIHQCPALHQLHYAVAVLGDSHYGNQYCLGGQQLDEQLKILGAYQVRPPLLVDASASYYPDAEITAWGILLANQCLAEAA